MCGSLRAVHGVEPAEGPGLRIDPAKTEAGGRMCRSFHGIQG
jgi:hypothetical protein